MVLYVNPGMPGCGEALVSSRPRIVAGRIRRGTVRRVKSCINTVRRTVATVLLLATLGACQANDDASQGVPDKAHTKDSVVHSGEDDGGPGALAVYCDRFGAAFAQRVKDRETFMAVTTGLNEGSLSVQEAGEVMSEALRGGPVLYYQSLIDILMEVEKDEAAAAELRALARDGVEWYSKKKNQSLLAASAVLVVETTNEFYAVFNQLGTDAPRDYFSPEMDAYLEQEPACRAHADDLYNVPA